MSAVRFLHPRLVCLVLLCGLSSACVSRRLTIHSDPPGALVEVNGERVGLTPVSMDFTYYGTRQVTLSKAGYEPLTIYQPVPPPWYQVPPADFVSDNLLLGHVTDRHGYLYRLKPLQPGLSDEQNLLEAAQDYRSEAQLGPMGGP